MSLLSKQHNKIIVKVGSAVLTDDQGRVKKKILNNIARDIAALKNRKIVLVSSGAIAIVKMLHKERGLQYVKDWSNEQKKGLLKKWLYLDILMLILGFSYLCFCMLPYILSFFLSFFCF